MFERIYKCSQCPLPCEYTIYLEDCEETEDSSIDNTQICLLNKDNKAKWELLE